MEHVKLGNSDLRVSRICLGCMGFGDATIGQHSWTIGEEPTRDIIRRSLDLGVNFFDTAIAYQLGTSEQFVGRALRDVARRDDVVVATKFLPRTDEDSFMHFKYDSTAEQDNRIVERVVELADRYGVEMTQISLAWLLTKVESPIVGATRLHHIEGAVKSLDVHLTADDIRYLEEPYVPHNLSGVMAVNKPVMNEEPVWVAASKNK